MRAALGLHLGGQYPLPARVLQNLAVFCITILEIFFVDSFSRFLGEVRIEGVRKPYQKLHPSC
jgi:hypothetical protein